MGLKDKGKNHPIKLIDFGVSARFKRGEALEGAVGTLYSMAPEMVQHLPYSETVDVWSAGCVAFELCVGHAPYLAADRQSLLSLIRKREVLYEPEEWVRHPKELQAVVREMFARVQKPFLQTTHFLKLVRAFQTQRVIQSTH